MKIVVTKAFTDRISKVTHKPGEELERDEERAKELIEKGFVIASEKVQDATVQPRGQQNAKTKEKNTGKGKGGNKEKVEAPGDAPPATNNSGDIPHTITEDDVNANPGEGLKAGEEIVIPADQIVEAPPAVPPVAGPTAPTTPVVPTAPPTVVQ